MVADCFHLTGIGYMRCIDVRFLYFRVTHDSGHILIELYLRRLINCCIVRVWIDIVPNSLLKLLLFGIRNGFSPIPMLRGRITCVYRLRWDSGLIELTDNFGQSKCCWVNCREIGFNLLALRHTSFLPLICAVLHGSRVEYNLRGGLVEVIYFLKYLVSILSCAQWVEPNTICIVFAVRTCFIQNCKLWNLLFDLS